MDYQFDSGIYLDFTTVEKLKSSMFSLLKNELPQEAQIVEVLVFLFEQCKEDVDKKRVML